MFSLQSVKYQVVQLSFVDIAYYECGFYLIQINSSPQGKETDIKGQCNYKTKGTKRKINNENTRINQMNQSNEKY